MDKLDSETDADEALWEPGANSKAPTTYRLAYRRTPPYWGTAHQDIIFQDGPIAEHGRNGTTNEDVIRVLVHRIGAMQTMEDRKFACRENALAITHLEEALHWLLARTRARQARGVEGTKHPVKRL